MVTCERSGFNIMAQSITTKKSDNSMWGMPFQIQATYNFHNMS